MSVPYATSEGVLGRREARKSFYIWGGVGEIYDISNKTTSFGLLQFTDLPNLSTIQCANNKSELSHPRSVNATSVRSVLNGTLDLGNR